MLDPKVHAKLEGWLLGLGYTRGKKFEIVRINGNVHILIDEKEVWHGAAESPVE